MFILHIIIKHRLEFDSKAIYLFVIGTVLLEKDKNDLFTFLQIKTVSCTVFAVAN